MEHNNFQLKNDIFKRYEWFDSLFSPNNKVYEYDLKIPLRTMISISSFYSVAPDSDFKMRRNPKSEISSIMNFSFAQEYSERIKIIGPIKKYWFFPVLINVKDFPFVSALRPEIAIQYEFICLPLKLFVSHEDKSFISIMKDFGHTLYPLYAFNCFRTIERKIGDSNMWIAEVPECVGDIIMEWQSSSEIPINKKDSPAILLEYFANKKSKDISLTINFERTPCSLSEEEIRIVKRTKQENGEEKSKLPESKQGYINTDVKYGKSRFVKKIVEGNINIQHMNSDNMYLIGRGTEAFFRDETTRILFN